MCIELFKYKLISWRIEGRNDETFGHSFITISFAFGNSHSTIFLDPNITQCLQVQ